MLLTLFSFTAAFAQVLVKGTILDESGETVIGASVMIKGTTQGTITDFDGKFSLKVQDNATLVVSYIGYATQEIPTQGKTNIEVRLVQDTEMLDEVVVVGYGVQKKVNLTGSVATVGAEKIANRPLTTLEQALAGAAPGVSVTQGSGAPGAEGISIRVRGTGSFNSSTPLIIVDGVQADMDPLNTDDIESISILKDASSAAIYGARAANGVILVTTKKGKNNEKPRVTFNALFASQQPVTDYSLMGSTADFMELHNIAKINAQPTSAGSPDYSYSDIEEWRAANANPNGIYTNQATGQQIPNWLIPTRTGRSICFSPRSTTATA